MSQNKFESLKESLRDEYACYIVITCAPPASDGKMSVEMTYEGDEMLASYLLDNAQEMIQEKLSH